MKNCAVEIDSKTIVAYCTKWSITELSLFGSVLREDFRADSDVDVLIKLSDDAPWSLFDWIDMKDELAGILGRNVDLVEFSGLRNPFRRHAILSERQILYAA